MNIVILSGSIRPERQSHRLACYLNDQLHAKGIAARLIDLKHYPLPLFGSVLTEEERSRIEEIGSLLLTSDAVIIVTPEYLSNIPAGLQNLLEHCGKQLAGKVTAVASASATKHGGLHASNNLQISLLNMGACPAQRRLLVPEIHLAFNEQNEVLRQEIGEQAERFIRALLSYTAMLTGTLSSDR